MDSIHHDGLGEIRLRRTSSRSAVRFSLSTAGVLKMSLPKLMPVFMAKRIINSSADELRKLLESKPSLYVKDGTQVGKRHILEIRQGVAKHSVRVTGNRLIVTLAAGQAVHDAKVQDAIRATIIRILRKEAKEHLPGRIRHLADTYGFTYEKLRFTHAGTRWGSCSSNKTISLNIALMSLPFELIDYVLLHELAHTVEMNHSKAFWNTVAQTDPSYENHRNELKSYSPVV